MAPTKNAHGKALTAMPAMTSRATWPPLMYAIANRTSVPAATINVGMRIAHANPITACLYRMRTSRSVSS